MLLIIATCMALTAIAIVLLPIFKPGVSKQTLAIIGLIMAAPLSGLIGYEMGKPSVAPVQATSKSNDEVAPDALPAPDPIKMVEQLEAKLKNGEGTPDQWVMLARSYVTLKRHQDAVSAYAKATEKITNDAQIYADYADALAMSRGGLDKDSEALIDKAMKIDPLNPKALSLKATVAFNNKDYQSAITLWEKLLTVPGLSQDWINVTRGSIDEARGLLKLH